MILTAFHGFCMALADSVPGVSGGTIAFILGFYDRFINALHGLFRGNWKQRKAALTYLLKLGIGWGIGMVSCVVLLSSLFEQNIYHNAGKQWCRLDLGSGWAALHKEIPEVWDHSAGRSCHGCSGWQCIPEASDCPSAPLLAGSKRTASDCCPERLLVPIRSYAGLCYRCNDPDRSG